jgi:hypothetical protein
LIRHALAPARVVCCLDGAVFALFHGAAHGFELAGPAQYMSLAGMLATTLLLLAMGIVLGAGCRAAHHGCSAWVARPSRCSAPCCSGRSHDPGELLTDGPDLELNPGRRTLTLVVENSGDRPIQVGSHYHFAETNARCASTATPRAACG